MLHLLKSDSVLCKEALTALSTVLSTFPPFAFCGDLPSLQHEALLQLETTLMHVVRENTHDPEVGSLACRMLMEIAVARGSLLCTLRLVQFFFDEATGGLPVGAAFVAHRLADIENADNPALRVINYAHFFTQLPI
jgi:hypothetical protein